MTIFLWVVWMVDAIGVVFALRWLVTAYRMRGLVDYLESWGLDVRQKGARITTIHVVTRDGRLRDWTKRKWTDVAERDALNPSTHALFRIGHRSKRKEEYFVLLLKGPFVTDSYEVWARRQGTGGYRVEMTSHGRGVWGMDKSISYDGTPEELPLLTERLFAYVRGWCVYHYGFARLVLAIRGFAEETRQDFPDKRVKDLHRLAQRLAGQLGISEWTLDSLETDIRTGGEIS